MTFRSRQIISLLFALFLTFSLAACSSKEDSVGYMGGRYRGTKSYTVRGKTYHPYKSSRGYRETGIASWYGPGFHGKKTSNGERYDQNAMTAAHKLLPFGTRLRVTNLDNGRVVTVRINDRGPFVGSRIIDLSKEAARQLHMIGRGTARVQLVAIGEGNREAEILTPDGDMLGLFYIQLGAFTNIYRADRLATFMRSKGYGCRIARHERKMQDYYVQLGPYLSRSEAEKVGRTLKRSFKGLFIIAE
ncbi:MAG: septal ring lytic transglycosylase RlpA family protein [Mailhella sp.]|nr:septal ring lytic transglycosylase RlpA family protein [Mailhella sp.]